MRPVQEFVLVQLGHDVHTRAYVHRALLRNVVDTQDVILIQEQQIFLLMIVPFGNVLHVFGEQDVIKCFELNVDPSIHALLIDARAAPFQIA